MPVVVMGRLYAALRSAGVSEQLALEAAEEVATARRQPPLFPLHVPVIVLTGAATCFAAGMLFAKYFLAMR
jgi:hypothetical protein